MNASLHSTDIEVTEDHEVLQGPFLETPTASKTRPSFEMI